MPDTSFGGTTERCWNTIPPVVELPAHSAPLGLVFYTGHMCSRLQACCLPRPFDSSDYRAEKHVASAAFMEDIEDLPVQGRES